MSANKPQPQEITEKPVADEKVVQDPSLIDDKKTGDAKQDTPKPVNEQKNP